MRNSTEGKTDAFYCNFSIILTILLLSSDLGFIKETRQQGNLRAIFKISDYLQLPS